MKMRFNLRTRQGLRIAGALVVILLGVAPLSLRALPYGELDWNMYDPSYGPGLGYPAAPAPTAVVRPLASPTPVSGDIPCAELPAPGEPVVAYVNGQGIGLWAFEREMLQLLTAMEMEGSDVGSAEFQAQLPEYRRQVLDSMILDVLVQQEAYRAGITVEEELIDALMTQEVARVGGTVAFQAWLDETHQTWEEFERSVCQAILNESVKDWVTTDITSSMEMVWARQIVVDSEEDATAALTRLSAGEEFVVVAYQVSQDAETREDGGDLGWLPRGVGWASPAVEEAAFSGQSGQVKGPIPVGDQFYIVQTLLKEAEHSLDPEALDLIRWIAFEEWLSRQREAAEIEVLLDLESGTW